MQIGAVEFARVLPRQAQRVRDYWGRIASGSPIHQPVFEYSGNVRALLRTRSFPRSSRSEARVTIFWTLWCGGAPETGSVSHSCRNFYSSRRSCLSRPCGAGTHRSPGMKTFEAARAGSKVENRRRVARGSEKFVASEETFAGGKVRDVRTS